MIRVKGICLSILLGAAFLCGCSALTREQSAPPPVSRANVQGFTSTVRYLAFEERDAIRATIKQAYLTETPDCYDIGPAGEHIYNYLAISGGGSDGAFGAGLLNGWSESGKRPRFKFVTGVSTGALIAPFAFLGSDYDDELKASYTTIDASHIFTLRGILPLLWSEALTSTKPLQQLIGSYINEELLDAIAAEHAKGRRLYVASTNLDAEQPVIWDLGAIAASGSPDRLTLFRKVLLASAAIPTVFPPVMMDVTEDGKKYQEMHVDGGVVFQSFSVGSLVSLPEAISAAHPEFHGKVEQNLYVLRNGWVSPTFQPVERELAKISVRAVLSMFKMSGINDLWRLYLTTRDDNVSFHYIAIPAEYVPSTTKQFDKAEMNQEFDLGYEMARNGINWKTEPPGYTAPIKGLSAQ
ncbi:MAG: patatin-like phospholipase family protein [Dongiaceae bacterium]